MWGYISQTFTSPEVIPDGDLPDDSAGTELQPQYIPVHNKEVIKNRYILVNQYFRNRAPELKFFPECFTLHTDSSPEI